MKRKLLLSIALALCYCIAQGQPIPMTEQEGKVMEAHRNEILGRALYFADEATMRTHMRYRVLRRDEERLARYIREREIRKCCYDFIYPDSLKHRVANKMGIDEFYTDSINTILLAANIPNISGENVTFVIFRADMLELDSTQHSCIMSHALDMARRIRRNPRLDVWDEEMNVLTKTLTTRQLDKFFYIRHSTEIAREVNSGWKRLEEAGLTEELDSAQDVVKARMYLTQQRKIYDIWRHHDAQRRQNLDELGKQMPPLIRLLDALNRREKINEEENKNKTIGKEFSW